MRIENDTINYYKRNVSRYVSQTHTPTHFNIIILKNVRNLFRPIEDVWYEIGRHIDIDT